MAIKHQTMIGRFFLFLLINFAALAIGGLATKNGVVSEWYVNLNKAPWTPPGWVFGAAWTFIMIAFSVYLATLWPKVENQKMLISLFILQWILNVAWNPVFFNLQQTWIGLFLIVALTILVALILVKYNTTLKLQSLWLAPYFIWLLIATSLNAYICFKN